MSPPTSFSPAAVLRKAGPYLMFLALGIVMLYGPALLHWLLAVVHGVGQQPHIEPADVAPATRALAAMGDSSAVAVLDSVKQFNNAAALNATGAEVIADQQAAGWPTPGLVTGKLITAGGAYLFFTILPWLVQHLTHPALTQWAKKGYSRAFVTLPEADKFPVYQRMQFNQAIRIAASLVFAALVQ